MIATEFEMVAHAAYAVNFARQPNMLWVSDDRLALCLGPEGPRAVNYWGPLESGETILSNHGEDFYECLRQNVCIDGMTYAAEEGPLTVYPFGLSRTQTHGDEQFTIRTGIWLAENCVVFSFDLLGRVTAPVFGEVVLWPQVLAERFGGRVWADWGVHAGVISTVATETARDGQAASTHLAITGSGASGARVYAAEPLGAQISHHRKIRFQTGVARGHTGYLVVALGADAAETTARAQRVATTADTVLTAQHVRYAALAARAPKLTSSSPMLERFMALMPLQEEALKVLDVPGTQRAKTASYWVWLWDGGLPGLVAPLHGDGAHAAAMARFFHAHASPVIGIPFDYPRTFVSSLETLRGLDLENFKHPERINYTIQGLFEILVHDVAALVGDESVLQDTYDYIRIHFRAIAGRTLGETGLLIGSSAFPDFPKFMQETGEDLSAYNNGVWYNACRKVERLALLMADEETALLARELAVKIEQSFWQVFWDEETGYLASSADLHGQRRKVYTSTNTFWDFGYGDELCDGYAQRIVAYQLAHFYSKMGISIVSPKHPHVWDGDGNQFHCSWPVLDNHNLKVALQARNAQALAYFVPWVEHLLARHTVPEAIQMRTTKPFPVAYDPGSWQAYTASSWYRAVVESLLGVTLDAGGVTVAGTSAEPMTLSGLHYRDATLTITTRGRGWQIADFRVDGQVLPGTQQAPAYLLTPGSHSLSITRADTPPACWTLLAANGTSVEVRHATAQRWDGEVNGLGLTRLRVYAPGLRCVRIDGQSAAYRGSEWPHVFWIDTDLRPGQVRRVELSASQEQQHD